MPTHNRRVWLVLSPRTPCAPFPHLLLRRSVVRLGHVELERQRVELLPRLQLSGFHISEKGLRLGLAFAFAAFLQANWNNYGEN